MSTKKNKKSSKRISKTSSKGKTASKNNRSTTPSNSKPTSQAEAVLNHLQKRKSITSNEAIKLYGATRLSGIIYNLRQRGNRITSIEVVGKNRFGNTTKSAKYLLA